MIRALSQAEIDALAAEGREELRRERSAAEPEVVNLDEAIALYEPAEWEWDGQRYAIRPISFRAGMKIEAFRLRLKAAAEHPAQTEAELAALLADVDEMLDLFWSLLSPRPAENPFADATPQEVGQLALGFWMRLTGQNGSRLGAAWGRHSPHSTT